MLLRYSLTTALFLISLLVQGRAFLFPLLFPVSIKITIHKHHEKPLPPPPKPNYHFQPVPIYKEFVVKGSAHINTGDKVKHSYGDGQKYGTSYGDGHVKVYTEEPHVKNHKYSNGYGTGSTLHFPSPEYVEVPVTHHKGSPYIEHQEIQYVPDTETHYKGTHYEDTQQPETHHKGTPYGGSHKPEPHYKGTEYHGAPETHYKGTEYHGAPETHYKGTEYHGAPEPHYPQEEHVDIPVSHDKGTAYVAHPPPPKGSAYGQKVYDHNHSFIKSVGGYKVTDYIKTKQPQQHDKSTRYVSQVAIPAKIEPGHSYAEIEAAHRASHSPKAYDSKEYADLGVHQYKPQQEGYGQDSAYLDDTLPAYKYKPTLYLERSGQTAPISTEPTTYAGYGTSIYGDSYAKIVYEPKRWKVSRNAYRHR